jgi:L-Lysine epsilon oxidase N-terminal
MPTTFEIHPTIGIARVGTSEESFIGLEPGLPAPTTYRDAAGDLLRQAARFRVFRCERGTNGELTSATDVTPTSTIDWTVRLGNRKAAAPQFAP